MKLTKLLTKNKMFNKMKKFSFLACAAMLASAVAFTSCSSEEEIQGQREQVSTDIAIALPGQLAGHLRMPGATVQTSGVSDFTSNGMKDLVLVPFAPSADVTNSSKRLGSNIDLGHIGYNSAEGLNSNNTKVFTGKNVPVGTSAFLFYGESGKSSTNKFETGVLNADYADSKQPSNFTFSLEKIQATESAVTGNDAYIGLLAYINSVANAEDENHKAWKDYQTIAENASSTDNQGFAELWAKYKTTTNLNSFAVAKMMTDLYQSLMPLAADNTLATNLKNAISNATYATVDGSGVVTLASELQGFPANVKLPDGSIAVAWNTTNKAFEGSATKNFSNGTDNLNVAPISSYVYAPSLWYFANSKIGTSNTSEAEHYAGASDWDAVLTNYSANGSVTSATRSIAIQNPIQYAVGRLEVHLKAAASLNDNDPIAANQAVATPDAGYELTGVLVGGQKHVGFDFTPGSYAGGDGVAYTIYDNVMTQTVKSTTSNFSSASNSTLVLQTADNEDVLIAIELINGSTKDFYGADGIVPVGGKFYLVGKLVCNTVQEGKTKITDSVFKQDYTTTANLTIGSLQKAYNTIPDLKAPQLEIGLTVDLQWTEGNTYSVEL